MLLGVQTALSPGSHTYECRSDEGCGNLAQAGGGLISLTCVSQLCGTIAGPSVWLPSLSAQHPFLALREVLSSYCAQLVTTLTPSSLRMAALTLGVPGP